MKKTIILVSMLALGAMGARGDLITNGGFEDATPSPWVADAGAAVSVSTASANSGSQSGQVDFPAADLGGIFQNITPTPADLLKTYTFSFSVNVEATGYSELLGIRPAVGEWNGVTPIVFDFGDIEWIPAGTTGWQTYSQDFTLVAADTVLVQARLYTYPQGGPPKVAGSVLVDDISLIPEPSTLGLAGVFGAVLLFVRRRIRS